ncbi:hypothetical protein Pmar_PMAR005936 [Perkinsus marinus ATCC 50983]|uniref:Uncharacterized protein n=1 Tax=Perkinsus marinus (strain ATCC 50983 / TXsc) TaxID=423536 RepID=C5LL32_PERM5|nr:hypothetical protein Pmar_PMAR005936 [Perkinsus marinus ATCC 50983]EER02596.1 hypothetical protein Pmar_PMAR005936 [Perkinsus marinus ATCC 50983]|eukprot:XP_002769878.1 hypothetical protein Pmar_PMAR005936 [Perkinsus marinus ATCC 50983]
MKEITTKKKKTACMDVAAMAWSSDNRKTAANNHVVMRDKLDAKPLAWSGNNSAAKRYISGPSPIEKEK